MLNLKRNNQRGFTLIELTIAIVVAGILFAAVWRVITLMYQQIQDQAVANHTRIIARAALNYTRTERVPITTTIPANTWVVVPFTGSMGTLPALKPNFLASAIRTYNIIGQQYNVLIRHNGSEVETFVTATGPVHISSYTQVRGARIAGLIGADGGFIYEDDSRTAQDESSVIAGSYGTWILPVSYFDGSGITLNPRDIIAATYYLAATGAFGRDGDGGDDGDDDGDAQACARSGALCRNIIPLHPEANRMETHIDMNTKNLNHVGGVFANLVNTDKLIVGENAAVQDRQMKVYSDADFMLRRFRITPPLGDPNYPTSVYMNLGPYGEIKFFGSLTQIAPSALHRVAFQAPMTATTLTATTINVDYLTVRRTFTGPDWWGSDLRLKKDVKEIESPLEKIARLRGVSYTWKKDGKKGYGVIAQDVEKVFPELVKADKDGMKGVDYTHLVGPVIAAIKELKQENDDLRARLEKLEEKSGDK